MQKIIIILLIICLSLSVYAQDHFPSGYKIFPFGEGGQLKMLYDRRQRPPSVYLDGKVYVVFNGGGQKGPSKKSPTSPMITVFDPETNLFSHTVMLGPAKKDHHYGPVIWADDQKKIHVLYGCHSSPGTHLISKEPKRIGKSMEDWEIGTQIAPKMSYPTTFKIKNNQQLIYYRTAGHTSSWAYKRSIDNGKTWTSLENDVTDLDIHGSFQWSSYQTKLPSTDGKYLHVAFIAYDDNKAHDPKRYYNPRYKKAVSNEWKYNLYYIKINLETDEVTNYKGEVLDTPIDLKEANSTCRIWDTEGRGAGVPPDIVIDENGNPAFLHVLSEETTEQHNYYFVRLVKNRWEKTVIAPSNHQWNGSHIRRDQDGQYHAFLIVGEEYIDTEWVEGKNIGEQFQKGQVNYLKTGGYMDKHGGGHIEEWISKDQGNTWIKYRDLTRNLDDFSDWRFNNVQPVTYPDGSLVDGMLLFYGWKDKNAPEAKAFLLIEDE